MIKAVAFEILASVDSRCQVARWGGDEFIVLVRNMPHSEALLKVAESISQKLKAAYNFRDKDIYVGASIGAVLSSLRYHSAEEMLRDGDNAMYRAKSDKRSSVRLFEAQMHEIAVRSMRLSTDLRKAIERGLMRPDAQLSDRDLFGFVLETGFSTAEQVTKIAGRGVGMDVVASEIKQLGGTLAIDSVRGKGTEFIIRLPFTLAVTQAIQVRLGEQVFAVPMSSVQGVARIARDDFERRITQPHPVFTYAGEEYVIHELSGLLGLPSHRLSDVTQLPLLLARTGDQRAAVRVDTVMGSREIVVKSVGPQVSSVPGIFGATIMGDGSVVMILDLAPLVRRSAALRAEVAVEAALEEALPGLVPEPVAIPEARRQPLVMVVDDSITMRKVTSRVLERHDMEVITAKDGLDAVEKLQDRIPDLVLLDIEMPRMDGYELATYMRNDPRLRTIPIIMITSRTGEKHRQRAFEIGVDRYLGKPYQEADLLRNVDETLRLSRAVH